MTPTLPQRLRRAYTAALGALFDATNPREIWRRPAEISTARRITEEVSPSDRVRLVSDSQKLYANLGPCRGAIDGKAMLSVGRAWLPRFEGADKEWGKAAREFLLQEFYPIADIGGNDFQTALFLLSVSVDREGDAGAMLTEYETGFPAIQLVPGAAVGTRKHQAEGKRLESGPYKGLLLRDGVVLNGQGRPVAYLLLGDKEENDTFISARDLHWLKEPQWIGQVRGLPGFSSSILDLRDLRTTQGYEKMAAQLCSAIGILEYNESGLAEDDPKSVLRGTPSGGADLKVQEMDGGLIKYFKAGTGQKAEVFRSDRPGDAWQKMMDRLLRNAMAGINWPMELAWDLSALGGANTRGVVGMAMRAVADRQDLLRPFAKRAVGYACAKAIKMGRLPASADWWRWDFTMPARLTVDFGRDAKAELDQYLYGTKNLSDLCEERGEDVESFIARRQADFAMLQEAGLPLPQPSDLKAEGEGQGTEDGAQKTED